MPNDRCMVQKERALCQFLPQKKNAIEKGYMFCDTERIIVHNVFSFSPWRWTDTFIGRVAAGVQRAADPVLRRNGRMVHWGSSTGRIIDPYTMARVALRRFMRVAGPGLIFSTVWICKKMTDETSVIA